MSSSSTGTLPTEQRTLDDEEASGLNAALARVSPEERDLLVRHELSGTDLATLAGEAGVSRGAIAMRLPAPGPVRRRAPTKQPRR